MSQAVKNLINYVYRAFNFLFDLIKKFLGIGKDTDVTED